MKTTRRNPMILVCLLTQATTTFGLNFNVTLGSLTNHNTSAYAAYNQANFTANFGTNTWVSQDGTTMPIDPTKMDMSLNPITPGHVSKTDVHTLIPSRPDLRWFAHATPWFGSASHIDIGLNCNTTSYVAAMIADMKARGFNGVVINWYGQGHTTDGVTQKVKAYLQSIPGNTFKYILMLDKGVQGGLSTNNLVTQIQYCQSQYFSDTNYEREPVVGGSPMLMFFGVRSALGASAMSDLKTETTNGTNIMNWVEQGTSYLGESWENQCFEWTQEYQTGVNYSDPFNLAGCTNHYNTIRTSGKKAFGAMCGNFNGTLTKSVSWSMGKYLPSSNGLCVVQRAAAINAVIPPNITRMQWTTWSDWEEGTQIESGIENNFELTASVNSSNILSWTVSGDERTVDHYEIYASTNGVYAALLGTVRTNVYQTNLTQVSTNLPSGTYQLYVDAVAKPCIRDHMSPPVSYIYSSGTPFLVTDLQPLSQTVWEGDPISFSVAPGGAGPFTYQWTLNGQSISGAANSTYSFAALVGTNRYAAVISNASGSVNSSTGVVVGVAATFLTGPSNYNSMRITFSGYTNGAALRYFPVLVRLSTSIPGFSYSQFVSPSDGADLRFTSANGRELPFQIEQWNPAGESLVWVQMPSLASPADYITAYWGNSADSTMSASNTNGTVWSNVSGSNNFVIVYHLNESGFPFADSTLQHPATSGSAPSSNSAIIGRGCAFNGSQFLNSGAIEVGKTFTASAWVNISPTVNNEQTIWCNKQGGWNVAGFDFYVNSYQTNDGIIYFDSADGVGGNVSPRTATHAVSFGQWHLLTGTMDGVNGSVHVYVDGVDQTINTGVDTAFQTTNYVRCGALLTGAPGATGGLPFNGLMDEARVENGARSPAWVYASWATVANSAFTSYGPIALALVTLQYQNVNGQLVLSWAAGTLQAAPAATGPYADMTGVSSPYTNTPSNDQQYFRVKVR